MCIKDKDIIFNRYRFHQVFSFRCKLNVFQWPKKVFPISPSILTDSTQYKYRVFLFSGPTFRPRVSASVASHTECWRDITVDDWN